MSINEYLNAGLAISGYVYITFKAGEWLTGLLLKSWVKRKKDSRKQKAVYELFDAFGLDDISDGSTIRVKTNSGLTMVIYREDDKS
ncbi:hypothetical protein P88_00570 [Erwinia phage phiEt88]|uniref:hypothetical protein n=1 Tax=Erwinia phage phiEt88 TaxID=925984 RepID=UPI0001F1FC89|nr:hypothetical protein ErPhphiEt88_gp57 [Erwinia phage phiEt88]CBX44568.1 hypothetical protein P88_00570 [Erwinia phage phiEt88]